MSQPITEIVQIKLQRNAAFEDQMPEFTRILQRQPGFLHLAWGCWVESPDNVQILLSNTPFPLPQLPDPRPAPGCNVMHCVTNA